ncbi:hypothetical protein ABEF95_009764 [Exophiala dermatitidis]
MCKCSIILTDLLCAGCRQAGRETQLKSSMFKDNPKRAVTFDKSCRKHGMLSLPSTKQRVSEYVEDRHCKVCRQTIRTVVEEESTMGRSGSKPGQYMAMPVRSHNDDYIKTQRDSKAYAPGDSRALVVRQGSYAARGSTRPSKQAEGLEVVKADRYEATQGRPSRRQEVVRTAQREDRDHVERSAVQAREIRDEVTFNAGGVTVSVVSTQTVYTKVKERVPRR